MKYISPILLILVISIKAFTQQADTVLMRTWSIDPDFGDKIIAILDTSVNEFQIYNPVFKESYSNSYLGGVGLPSKNNLFYQDELNTNFIFQNSFSAYTTNSSKVKYYYTERPFTNINYASGNNEEQWFRVLHTQNVNKNLNFGISYNVISSEGYYLWQLDKHKFIETWVGYDSKYYELHTSYSGNNLTLHHNGGIIDDAYILDPEKQANVVLVKLNDSKAELNSKYFDVDQRIKINSSKEVFVNDTTSIKEYKPLLAIGHRIRYDRAYRNFYDNVTSYYNPEVSDTLLFDYYSNKYNATNSFDSSFTSEINNEIFIQLYDDTSRFINIGATVKAGQRLKTYSLFNKDTLFDYSNDTIYSDLFFGFRLFNKKKLHWNWELSGIIYNKGYSAGDMTIKGFASRKIYRKDYMSEIKLDAKFIRQKNDFFLHKYSSNHFRWDSNFLAPEKTKITLSYKNVRYSLDMGVQAAFMDNYIYFNYDALPQQSTNTFDVYTAYINKTIKLWKINFSNKFTYQQVQNERIMPLPKYNYYGSLYYNDTWFNWKWVPKTFNDVLKVQIGVDFYYHSSYYGYAYMPAIEQFYIQDERLIGNYPIINVFANIKLVNTRIFVIYEHLNADFINNNRFMALHYPLTEPAFKFGLSWSFYN